MGLLDKLRGRKATALRSASLMASSGSFAVKGAPCMLLKSWEPLRAASGQFTLKGFDSMPRRLRVAFPSSYRLTAQTGNFTVTGKLANLTQGFNATGDFASRAAAPGVFLSRKFSSSSDLGIDLEAGGGAGALTPTNYYGYGASNNAGGIKPTVTVDSKGLHITCSMNNSFNTNRAYWLTRFRPDDTLSFAENTEFYIQFSVEHDGYLNYARGPKQFFIESAGPYMGSDTRMTIIGNSTPGYSPYGAGVPPMPAIFGIYCYSNPYDFQGTGGEFVIASGDTTGQGASYPDMQIGCPYGPYGSTTGNTCWAFPTNQKSWLQFGLKIFNKRPDLGNLFWDVQLDVWATDSSGTRLIMHSAPGVGNYHPLPCSSDNSLAYGKFEFTTYTTANGIPVTSSTPMNVWYDELICSTQRIPNPSTGTSYPTWRQGLAVNTLNAIANTANMNGLNWAATPAGAPASAVINEWCSFTNYGGKLYSALASGHNWSYNMVASVDLMLNAPSWTLRHPGTYPPNTNVSASGYYLDGLPVARHTYYSTQFWPAAQSPDSIDRIMSIGAYAVYPGTQFYKYVDSFRVSALTWDPAGTWPQVPANLDPFGASTIQQANIPVVCKDPLTGNIYVTSGDSTDGSHLRKFSPSSGAHGTWSTLTTSPVYPSATRMNEWAVNGAVCFDTLRGQLVCLNSHGSYHIEKVNVSTGAVTHLALSNVPAINPYPSPDLYQSALVYDVDNDRYVWARVVTNEVAVGTGLVQFWAIHPTSGAMSMITSTNYAPTNLIVNRFQYIPELRGIVYWPRFESNMFFLPTA